MMRGIGQPLGGGLADDKLKNVNESSSQRGKSSLPPANGALLDPFLADRALDDPVDVNAGRMHAVGIDRAQLNQLLDLDDRDLRSGRHYRIEVAGGFAELKIAEGV